jgi:hypothetical protein
MAEFLMPALRTDLREFVEDVIETEAAKDQREVGLGCSILYVRDRGAIVAYRISASTNVEDGRVGTSITYPDVAASREPTEAEIETIINDYATELVDAIKTRRAEIKAEAEDTKTH